MEAIFLKIFYFTTTKNLNILNVWIAISIWRRLVTIVEAFLGWNTSLEMLLKPHTLLIFSIVQTVASVSSEYYFIAIMIFQNRI